uniref:Putative secreted protein n=1 Tax=Ixodes ricinus TaxID=34613 RepID=A0A6B0TZA6_IXORI
MLLLPFLRALCIIFWQKTGVGGVIQQLLENAVQGRPLMFNPRQIKGRVTIRFLIEKSAARVWNFGFSGFLELVD